MKVTLNKLDKSVWDKFTIRQKTIVGHEDTKTIPLIFDWEKKTRKIYHKNFEFFAPHLSDLTLFLQYNNFDSAILRANLVMLKAGYSIAPHVDKGNFLNSTRRLHIAVETNPLCRFVVAEEEKVFKVGEVWEVNNTDKKHSVHNDGNQDRVNLIVDVQ